MNNAPQRVLFDIYPPLAFNLIRGIIILIIIIETAVFTRQVRKLLTDEDYRQLQLVLMQRPALGAVIIGSGGLRKVR